MDERGRWVNEVCVCPRPVAERTTGGGQFGEMALSLEEGGGGVWCSCVWPEPFKGIPMMTAL